MARSRKQQRIAARDEKEGKKIVSIIIGSTLVLLVLMYFIFQSS